MAKKSSPLIRMFDVSKPFDIKLSSKRIFARKDCSKQFFMGDAQVYRNKIGCYVFALRTSRGSLPYYVGRTWNSFEGEVFQPHKISDHYQQVVADHKGSPTITFVTLRKKKGPKPETVIKELEKHLIQMAYSRNPHLSNKQNIPKTRWTIKGVAGGKDGPGAPNNAEKMFKDLLGY